MHKPRLGFRAQTLFVHKIGLARTPDLYSCIKLGLLLLANLYACINLGFPGFFCFLVLGPPNPAI